nr:hypothetical protein Iba_chr06cCG14770 [Ipomoea batatas]
MLAFSPFASTDKDLISSRRTRLFSLFSSELSASVMVSILPSAFVSSFEIGMLLTSFSSKLSPSVMLSILPSAFVSSFEIGTLLAPFSSKLPASVRISFPSNVISSFEIGRLFASFTSGLSASVTVTIFPSAIVSSFEIGKLSSKEFSGSSSTLADRISVFVGRSKLIFLCRCLLFCKLQWRWRVLQETGSEGWGRRGKNNRVLNCLPKRRRPPPATATAGVHLWPRKVVDSLASIGRVTEE